MKKIIFLLLLPLFCTRQSDVKRKCYSSEGLLSIINYTGGLRDDGGCKSFYDYGTWGGVECRLHE